jgi:imidazoleglycerol-phosphate dehydratase
MLALFARHGRFDLTLVCKADTLVDAHHSWRTIGLCLGAAFSVGWATCGASPATPISPCRWTRPLVLCAVDISGAGPSLADLALRREKVGEMDTELVEEFLLAFVRKANITVHLRQLAGTNTHHIVEACFKALARALGRAVSIDEAYRDEIPSTKGVL